MRLFTTLALLAASSQAVAAVCPITDGEAFAEGAALFTGNTGNYADDYTATCGFPQAGSGDFQVEFTAPIDGRWVFDTFGSGYDTSLSQIDTADCATSIQCNDDTGGLQSQLTIDLLAGETALLSIDGYNGAVGDFIFNATWTLLPPPPVCAEDDNLGTAIGQALATGNTCGAINDFGGASCGGGQESEDFAYYWTAPSTDTYRVTTEGSSYDTALTVRDLACGELSCDDDGGTGLLSLIEFTANAGDEYYIVVDGFGSGACGDYVLNLEQGCADADGDGVCDINDVCTGDDATGDSDNDGTCDDTDFVQRNPQPRAGQQLTLQVDNAPPGAMVYFLVSTSGPGAGPCHPNGAVCVDILRPKILGSRAANAQGQSGLIVNVPPTATGRQAGFQAVWIDAGTGDKTEVDLAIVQ